MVFVGHRFLWSWIWNLRHLNFFFCYLKPFLKRLVVFLAVFVCISGSFCQRIDATNFNVYGLLWAIDFYGLGYGI